MQDRFNLPIYGASIWKCEIKAVIDYDSGDYRFTAIDRRGGMIFSVTKRGEAMKYDFERTECDPPLRQR